MTAPLSLTGLAPLLALTGPYEYHQQQHQQLQVQQQLQEHNQLQHQLCHQEHIQQHHQQPTIPINYYYHPTNEQQQSTLTSIPTSHQSSRFIIPSAPSTDNRPLDSFENSMFTSTQLENQSKRSNRSDIYNGQETISSLNKKAGCKCSSVSGACKPNSACTCVKLGRKCTDTCNKSNAKCCNPF